MFGDVAMRTRPSPNISPTIEAGMRQANANRMLELEVDETVGDESEGNHGTEQRDHERNCNRLRNATRECIFGMQFLRRLNEAHDRHHPCNGPKFTSRRDPKHLHASQPGGEIGELPHRVKTKDGPSEHHGYESD